MTKWVAPVGWCVTRQDTKDAEDGAAGDDRREMTFEEAERFVLRLLSDGRRHTTQEIDRASAQAGKRCPDSTVRFLSRLRLTGRIAGELSVPHRTWLWWDVDHPEAPAPPVE